MEIKSVIPPDGGLNLSVPNHLCPDSSWIEVFNVHFGLGYVEKVNGWKKFTTSTLNEKVRLIENYFKFNNEAYLLFATNSKIYKMEDDTKTFTDISGMTYTASEDFPVFLENAEDKIVYTNFINQIRVWNGVDNTFSDLGGTNAIEGIAGTSTVLRAKCMLYTNNFLMLGHTEENGTNYPQRIRWSKYGDINTWKNDANGSGQAGYADLTEGVDWIQRILQLNNYIVVYKERSIQVLSYVGGDTIWDKRPSIIGTGLIAPKAIVDLGDEHLFIGPDNVYSFDLIETKTAGDDVSKHFFSELLAPQYVNKIQGFFIEEVPEAVFAFASINSEDGELDMALVYNTETKKWSIREMPMSAYGYCNLQQSMTYDIDDRTFDETNQSYDGTVKLANAPINICGDVNGVIYEFDGTSKDGADLSCYLTTKLFDFDVPSHLKRLMRIQLMVSREDDYDLNVYIGTADNVNEPVSWNGPYTLLLSRSVPPWIDVDLTARYFCVKFETTQKSQPFKLSGYTLWYEKGSLM